MSGDIAEDAGDVGRRRDAPVLGMLRLLVSDAAGRAAAMLASASASAGLGAVAAEEAGDPLINAVRILAAPAGAPHAGQAARLTGMPEDELRGLVLAYRHSRDRRSLRGGRRDRVPSGRDGPCRPRGAQAPRPCRR